MRIWCLLLVSTLLSSDGFASQSNESQEKKSVHSSGPPFEHLGRTNEISTPCLVYIKKAELYLEEFEHEQVLNFELIRCFDRKETVVISFVESAAITKEQIEKALLNPGNKLLYKHGKTIELTLSKKTFDVQSVLRVK